MPITFADDRIYANKINKRIADSKCVHLLLDIFLLCFLSSILGKAKTINVRIKPSFN